MAMARSAAPTRAAMRTGASSGPTWARRTRPVVAPNPTAARMWARRRSERTWARTMRANTGHDVRAMMAEMLPSDGWV